MLEWLDTHDILLGTPWSIHSPQICRKKAKMGHVIVKWSKMPSVCQAVSCFRQSCCLFKSWASFDSAHTRIKTWDKFPAYLHAV